MINFSDIKAVAWDLDGTLIDSFELYVELAHLLAKEFGFMVPSRKAMLENYHGSLEDTLKNTFDIKSDELLEKVVKAFMEYQEKYYEEEVDHHFYDDAVELADQANKLGLKQIVVTNRAHAGRKNASPHSIIGKSKISHFIHEIKCRDQVEYPKPDSRVMYDWLSEHNIEPSSVLVVGDQYVDAQLAINLNARAILITRNGDVPHLDSLGEIKDKVFIVKTLHDIKLI